MGGIQKERTQILSNKIKIAFYIMKDKNNFLLGLTITLGTIIIGLISYIVYSEYSQTNKEPLRCPYQGWSYEHNESFEAGDGCNVCICNDGIIVCTELECNNLILEEDKNESI